MFRAKPKPYELDATDKIMSEIGRVLNLRFKHRTQPITGETYLNAYNTQALVFICVNRIASSMSVLPFQIYRRGNKALENVTNDPLFRIFRTPCRSRRLTYSQFRKLRYIYQEIAGEFYAEIVKNAKGEVVELNPIQPNLVEPILLERGNLAGFRIDHTITLKPDQVWSFLYPNPENPFRGSSPLTAISNQINSQEYMAKWFENLADTNGALNFVLTNPESLNGLAFTRLKERFKQLIHNFKRLSEPIVLEDNTKLETINQSPKNAGIDLVNEIQIRDILAAYEIPPLLVGLIADVNYSTAKTQLKLFRDACLATRLKAEEENIDNYILPEITGEIDKYFIKYDLDALQLFSSDPNEDANRFRDAWLNDGCTLNEYRQKGLGLPPVENGNVYFTEKSDFNTKPPEIKTKSIRQEIDECFEVKNARIPF